MFAQVMKKVEENNKKQLVQNGRVNFSNLMKMAWIEAKNLGKLFNKSSRFFIAETMKKMWGLAHSALSNA